MTRWRACRLRRLAQQLEHVGPGEVFEGLQRGGEELPQQSAEPLHLPRPVPDQPLVPAGEHIDRLGQVAITSDRAQLVGGGL